MKASKLIYIMAALALVSLLLLSGCNISIPGIEIQGMGGSQNGTGDNGDDNDTPPAGGDNTQGGTDADGKPDDGSGEAPGEKPNETPDDGTGENEGTGEHVCDYKLIQNVAATCTENGKQVYKCSCGEEREEVLLAGHTPVTLPAKEATENTPALTDGVSCSVCGYVIVKQEFIFSSDFTTPEMYDGDYGYKSLALLENGELLCEFYMQLDAAADVFHSSGKTVTSEGNSVPIVESFNFSSLGLERSEALAVWAAYRTDRPLYYWISTSVSYTSSVLNMHVSEEYAVGEVRSAINREIYEAAETMISAAAADSAYTTALAFHDMIISGADYAYQADGKTPSKEVYAHNIVGVMTMESGVCESYAKAFQLLLNFSGIENIFVSGDASGAHAWNLVMLDNGEWYWCDLTWDDTPDFMNGISHRYFCVNDTETPTSLDGPWVGSEGGFTATHIPYQKCDTGIDFIYGLPERATAPFEYNGVMLRDTFTENGMTYAVSGYATVQLVSLSGQKSAPIPNTVTYSGTEYTVTSIGIIKDGSFEIGSVGYDYAAKRDMFTTEYIYVPKTVSFIWDGALDIDSLSSIEVDGENGYFTSVDGVLFTKDMYTLIKYPSAKADKEYTLPENTAQIAAGAFANLYSNVRLKLEAIHLAEGTVSAGAASYGYSYTDTSHGNFVSHEWSNIRAYLSGRAIIYKANGEIFTEL